VRPSHHDRSRTGDVYHARRAARSIWATTSASGCPCPCSDAPIARNLSSRLGGAWPDLVAVGEFTVVHEAALEFGDADRRCAERFGGGGRCDADLESCGSEVGAGRGGGWVGDESEISRATWRLRQRMISLLDLPSRVRRARKSLVRCPVDMRRARSATGRVGLADAASVEPVAGDLCRRRPRWG